MSERIIPTYEHSLVDSLSEEELIALLKDCPKLVDNIDLKGKSLTTGYFIGLQWLADTRNVLYVRPKLDVSSLPTHFLAMLRLCLEHPEVYLYTDELFHIDFPKKPISIEQEADLITPLIIVQFLKIVRHIVKTGLKKGYYRIESNLKGNIKGKVIIGKTIKQNHAKNKWLDTYCSYDEFGINTPENKLIKKALHFVTRYSKLASHRLDFSAALDYIMPAFERVDDDVDAHSKIFSSRHPLFKDYGEAVYLAKVILRRFGYNLSSIDNEAAPTVPPFWIDMSKLFELYVLCKLREALDYTGVIFQAKGEYGYLDFLRTTTGQELVIDAKYKLDYKIGRYNIDDIRQISAYARDTGILRKLQGRKPETFMLDCLIIYPDDRCAEKIDSEGLLNHPIKEFERFYKMGIALPTKTETTDSTL